jgi:CBS domain-containing protein
LKARNLAGPQATISATLPAADAAAQLARVDIDSVLVVDDEGNPVGILSDEDVLRALLPTYVEETEVLARVLEEGAADILFRELEGKAVRDLLPLDRMTLPTVSADDTLIEVAQTMVRAHTRIVVVLDAGRFIGGIEIDHLLSHLIRRR